MGKVTQSVNDLRGQASLVNMGIRSELESEVDIFVVVEYAFVLDRAGFR